MKKAIRLTLFLMTLTVTFVACDKQEDPINGDNNDNNVYTECLIIYTVGSNENRRTLNTESEWDSMLDQLCDQAYNGNEVVFYNMNQSIGLLIKAKGAEPKNRTFTTTNRDEIKSWMKEMEKQGLTVRVTYDDGSGTWHGEAYATAPADNTMGVLIGTWHFNCMVVSQLDQNGHLINSDLYEPEAGGGSMYYTFSENGSVTLTVNGIDGTTATDNGVWSLSDDGVLSSELLPNGLDWNVNWITPNTMILSHNNIGTEEGDLYYQLQFESVSGAK